MEKDAREEEIRKEGEKKETRKRGGRTKEMKIGERDLTSRKRLKDLHEAHLSVLENHNQEQIQSESGPNSRFASHSTVNPFSSHHLTINHHFAINF